MHRGSPPDIDPNLAPLVEPPVERRRTRSERRRSQRRSFVVAVRQEVVATPANPAELHLAQSSDLGLGGMRVWRHCEASEPELPTHTPVRLAFQLPDDMQLLEVAGEVVFDRSPGSAAVSPSGGDPGGQTYRATGVRFSELPDEVLLRLRTFLDD